MFSPEATSRSVPSQRNPRRRQRTSSEDQFASRQAPKRRKRSSLTPSTFQPAVNNIRANGHLHKSNGTYRVKSQSPELHLDGDNVSKKTGLAVRQRQHKSEKDRRAHRWAEGMTLAKSKYYTVTRESAMPDDIQEIIRSKDVWQAHFNSDLGYALILTHSKVVIWRYLQPDKGHDPSRVLIINLPQIPNKPKDALPLGTLVHDSGAGEMALLVLQHNGKISYWESVSNAAHADTMRQRQQITQGSVGSLFSGESIVDISNAEPDGFILTSNAGRVIHLAVRDSQGKLAIRTELLRGSSAVGSGFLGGIRSVFSSSGWRKDIAAARCATLHGKSHRKCVVVTKQCVLQTWNLVRHSTKTLEIEVDAKPTLLNAILPFSNSGSYYEFQAIDFSFFPSTRHGKDDSHHILILAEAKTANSTQLFLVDVTLSSDALDINSVHRITCWDQPFDDDKPWLAARPRILLPPPAHTAIVILDAALIMVSLARVEEGPSSQLQRESDLLSEPYQDVLFFAKERNFHVIGSTPLSHCSSSDPETCLMFVNNLGLVQTSISEANEEEPPSARRAVLCQSKIEQAVFLGDAPNRLFDFVQSSRMIDWHIEEIEQATLRINKSILDSTSSFVSVINPSMENQLKDRATALKELIKFVSRWHLTDSVRWHLLWSAEKTAAARAIWQVYSKHLGKREELQIYHNDENIVLLRESVDMINEKFKHAAQEDRGETDSVRHYLINDIANIELLVPWAAHALTELHRDGLHDPIKQALLVDQANDIQINALETAFAFRESNAETYGISKALIQDGLYTGSYKQFPDIWTSRVETVIKVKDLAELSRECAIENEDPPEEGATALDIAVLLKLAKDAGRLASLACKVFEERFRTLRDREGESASSVSSFEQQYSKTRRELVVKLVNVELPEEGIKIAEKYEDVEALADVLTRSYSVCSERMDDPTNTQDEILGLSATLDKYREKHETYLEKYGLRWATAFYTLQLQLPDSVLTFMKDDRVLVKEFLESKPDLLKLKWMYEIGTKREFKEGAQDLLQASSAEASLWSKKVELSLAKLSILAGEETQDAVDGTLHASTRIANRQLATIEVQDVLHNYTRPLLRTALDHTAGVDLAMDSFGTTLKKKPMLAGSLRHGLEKVVKNQAMTEEELIDTLTLMHCPTQVTDDEDFAGRRYFLALQVASISVTEDPVFGRLQQQIIWRRCFLQDDWEAINHTEFKPDEAVTRETEETALFKTLLAGFSEGLFEEVPPIPPSALLASDNNLASLRRSERFASLPDVALEALCQDLSIEAKAFARTAEKGRLELWWAGIVDSVRAHLRECEDNDGAKLAKVQEEKRKVARKLANGEMPNGLPNGVHHSSSEEVEQDQEGDVVMG